ncbi:MAG: alkaline shock response membrane anchor protein AmaP [Aristaeellaceae bacterium]
MKKSILVRILTALGSIVLLALAGCAAAEAFAGVPFSSMAGQLLASGSVWGVLAKLLIILVMLVLAAAGLICVLPARRTEQNDFVMQKGENGAIGISIRAIEKQVRTCIAKHDVIAGAEVSIRESRDGLVILLNVDQVAGVNIPLSVGLLQKQIKQYVSGCTGVDVHEVRVMVENNTTNVVPSPFAVQDTMIPAARPAGEETPPATQTAALPEEPEHAAAPAASAAPTASEAPVEMPVVLPELPPMPEPPVEEDERPLHQRIFGAEEQPVFVPVPPELMADVQTADEEKTVEAEREEEIAELTADPDEDAADEALPMEAADAGAAYSEAAWPEEDDSDAMQPEEPVADPDEPEAGILMK